MNNKSIAIILNGAVQANGGCANTNRLTGLFLEELAGKFQTITPVAFRTYSEGFYDYDICGIRNACVELLNTYSKKILNYVVSIAALWRIAGNSDFLYIFYPGNLGFLASLISIIRSKPFGMYVRGDFRRSSNKKILTKFAVKLDNTIFKKASFILTTGSHFKDLLSLQNQNVDIVSPMIEVTAKDLYETRTYPANHTKKILFVSRLYKEKGFFVLLEALKKLRLNNIDFQCVCVGTGPTMSDIMSFIKREDLENCMTICGHISDSDLLKKHYYDSDIFVMPSFTEGFPRTLYESMTFGLPIITTFVGSISSLMSDGYNCLKIDVSNSEDLYLKLYELLQSDQLCETLGRNALETMKKFYAENQVSHAKQVEYKVAELNTKRNKRFLFCNDGKYGYLLSIKGLPYLILQASIRFFMRSMDKMYSFLICRSVGYCGKNSTFQYGVKIDYPHDVHIGNNVKVGRRVLITKEQMESRLIVGDGVYINKDACIDYSGEIIIESGVTISEKVQIYTHSHGYDPRNAPVSTKLKLGVGAWIGQGAVILQSVTDIGEGAIIGAQAVVTKNVDKYCIVAGNPAKVIKKIA